MSAHKETKAEATERRADEAEERAEAKAEHDAEKAAAHAAAHPPKAAAKPVEPKPMFSGTVLLRVTDPEHPNGPKADATGKVGAGTVCKIDAATTQDPETGEFVYNLQSADGKHAFRAKESQVSFVK